MTTRAYIDLGEEGGLRVQESTDSDITEKGLINVVTTPSVAICAWGHLIQRTSFRVFCLEPDSGSFELPAALPPPLSSSAVPSQAP